MKTPKLLLPLIFLGGILATSAHAQYVHLSFRDFQGQFLFRANSAQIPWNLTTGNISQFDIFYDPTTDLSSPLDPSKNVWRALVTSSLGNFEIVRPITGLTVSEDTLTFQYYLDTAPPYGSLDFTVKFAPLAPDLSLPVPPLVLGESHISISGDRSFYDIPDLAEGYGGGGYNQAKAEITQTVDFTPVPEPSTYGLCGAVLLASLTWWRRRAGFLRCRI